MKDIIEKCNDLIPSNAMAIHNILNNKGFDTYFVGGALRDFYLSEISNKKYKIKDWDMVTTARYEDMTHIFNKILRINENGRIVSKKGKTEILIPGIETTGVSINNQVFEVTPMHIKNGEDTRFIKDIYEDLTKRDFSMNTLVYSPKHGVISEFTNKLGQKVNAKEDIENGIIRCVGDANTLFRENRFAMIRAILFANRLEFEIEERTFEAIRDNVFEVNEINKGKMAIAFEKLIMGDITSKIEYIISTGLLEALCTSFNREYGYELISLLRKVKEDYCEYDYYKRLKFISNNFSNKDLVITLYKEFGVNKEILMRIN